MSFISVIATEKFITVMSDGLVVDIATGRELEQRYKKFSKIGKEQFVAFGGNKGVADKVFEVLGFENKERNLYELSVNLRNQLISEIKPNEASCQLVVGGVESGEIALYTFNNNPNQELKIQKPKGVNGEYSFLGSLKHNLNLDQEILKLYSIYGYKTPTKALKIQKKLNDLVAEHDKSVNKITFNVTIRK